MEDSTLSKVRKEAKKEGRSISRQIEMWILHMLKLIKGE